MKKHDVAKKMKQIPYIPNDKEKITLAETPRKFQGKKGKGSLNSVGKNEGEKHYLGKNEQPVA